MRQVEFVPFRLTDIAEIYSIRVDGKQLSELQEFIITFKDNADEYLKDDFNSIVSTLILLTEKGVAESSFRPEGSLKDRVCALPLFTIQRNNKRHGTLRLYCIRISENLLIVGGGGIKCTQTYEEDPILSEKVQTLQLIDNELSNIENEGKDLNSEINNLVIYIP